MEDFTVSNFSFNAILHLAHLARTKRLTDNQILRVMTRFSGVQNVRPNQIEKMVQQVLVERENEKRD